MTGGQMAPTTLPGQRTTSIPNWRDVEQAGSRADSLNCSLNLRAQPIRAAVLHSVKEINRAKKSDSKPLPGAVSRLGFAMVESCPSSSCPKTGNRAA